MKIRCPLKQGLSERMQNTIGAGKMGGILTL